MVTFVVQSESIVRLLDRPEDWAMHTIESPKTLSLHAQGALLDLDGVVVFTDKYHYLAWKKISDESNYQFDETVNNLCRGVPRMESLEVILRHNQVSLSTQQKEALADRKNHYYVELLQTIGPADLYPGVTAFLEKLKQRGIKIGLCSSSKNAPLVLDRLHLTPYFDTVITGADIRHAKPHPEIFLLGAKRLGLSPEQCLAFEDAPAGVDSALAAGMPCIGVGSSELLPQATLTMQSYDELDLNALFAKHSNRTQSKTTKNHSKTSPVATEWTIEEPLFDAKQIPHYGNKYLLGNGYLGCRGTMEEFEASELVGLMVAGLYDKVGDSWREPVNAPNPFLVRVLHQDKPLHLLHSSVHKHQQSLNFRQALHERLTVFATADNNRVTLAAKRFLSAANQHILALEYSIHCEQDAELVIETGVDTKIWDINGPHLQIGQPLVRGDITLVPCKTRELGKSLALAETVAWESFSPCKEETANGYIRRYRFQAKAGQIYRFWKYAALFTDNDAVAHPDTEAIQLCQESARAGFASLLKDHVAEWEKRWNEADVQIEGDPEGQFALRYSLYHLLAIAPEHSERVSIPARGLSGQVYKGAVFWDTEMFMVPFFLSTMPSVAKNLLLYRYHTLDGARRKAKEYGFEGAFYAWESQESGDDACSHFNVTDVFTGRPMRTYFRDKQIHISAAVAHAVHQYIQQTGDEDFLLKGGAEIVFECARFFQSYSYFKSSRNRYEFLDVTGPDEYHERVHNNAFTNRMVRQTFIVAMEVHDWLKARHPEFFTSLAKRLTLDGLFEALPELIVKTYQPAPDPVTGVIPQFDRYETLEDVSLKTLKSRLLNPTEYLGGGNGPATSTQIIKQADVILMLSLFPDEFPLEVRRTNWRYYEPRTEHGSSLSACAYARVAAAIGETEIAYPLFQQTATIDITGKSKQYIGPQYIGGTHPAANGGAWMVAVLGFGGLRIRSGGPSLEPRLPKQWKTLRFRFHWHGQAFTLTLGHKTVSIEADASNDKTICWTVGEKELPCAPGQTASVQL